MPTKVKIKVMDNASLRQQIDALYSDATNVAIARWSLSMARHILDRVGIDYSSRAEIVDGFRVNEQWQVGSARVHDVRQAALAVNTIARECQDETRRVALRASVHAIATGHMREHAMVASDYCIIVINMLYPYDMDEVDRHRSWQRSELISIIGDRGTMV